MVRWMVAVFFLVGTLLSGAMQARAQVARFSCAGEPVSNYDGPGQRIKVLKGCVIATGIASEITSDGPFIVFSLTPDARSRYLLNAHNIAEGGFIPVMLEGRSRIHGRLYNGERVQVASPWVHDITNGPNYLAAPLYVKVLPAIRVVVRPTPAPQSSTFSVRAEVVPNTMPYNSYPVLNAYSRAGAVCSALVVYDTGREPVSFNDEAVQPVPASGFVSWPWHEETKGNSGIAKVTCTYNGQTAEAQASFAVTHP